MSVVDALALFSYWRRHPPAHEILQAAYGVPDAPPRAPDDPSGLADLLSRHPDGFVRAS